MVPCADRRPGSVRAGPPVSSGRRRCADDGRMRRGLPRQVCWRVNFGNMAGMGALTHPRVGVGVGRHEHVDWSLRQQLLRSVAGRRKFARCKIRCSDSKGWRDQALTIPTAANAPSGSGAYCAFDSSTMTWATGEIRHGRRMTRRIDARRGRDRAGTLGAPTWSTNRRSRTT